MYVRVLSNVGVGMDTAYTAVDSESPEKLPTRRNCCRRYGNLIYQMAALALAIFTLLAILGLAQFLRGHVLPMVTSVTVVINKADVVFNLLYDYLCERTHLVSPADCIILQKALSLK
jgi:hypothetical protein